jgi:hypothetical protein
VTTLIERTPATRLTYFKASLAYLGFMTVWVYAFANTQRHVPGVFIFLALMAAMFVHFGAGFAIPRQETFALLAFPPLLAILGPGVNSLLWVAARSDDGLPGRTPRPARPLAPQAHGSARGRGLLVLAALSVHADLRAG